MQENMNFTQAYFSTPSAIVISTMFSVLVVFSSVGNILVMYVILRNRGMRTVTNYFLFNLSAADLLTFLQILPNVHYVITENWVFGTWFCRLSQFFTAFNIAISVFTFIGITADRYTAIMFPLRPRARPRTTLCFIVLIWAVAFVVGLPGLVIAHVLPVSMYMNEKTNGTNNTSAWQTPYSDDEETRLQCVFTWSPEWGKAYDFTLFTLMYALPLVVLTATYVPISIRLWFHHEIGEVTRAQIANTRSKRRAVKMMCTVMIIFAICWLPYQLLFLLLRVSNEVQQCASIPVVFIMCYWLAMSNSVFNPIIYFTMNRRFRNGLFNLCSSIPCLRCVARSWHSRRKSQTVHDTFAARNSSCSMTEKQRAPLRYDNSRTGTLPYTSATRQDNTHDNTTNIGSLK
ncbi:Tachykinin peptides receptor 99D [Fasciola hepatica]|uniref:Tachykinin peptides receptor 99D n=1 Tax=Fasciola hepatica TaxID=6192 RepID=A0A4E0RKK2_FASHE|nr:Tachykinin peptides receptor 99D [Fasciola hepatica]